MTTLAEMTSAERKSFLKEELRDQLNRERQRDASYTNDEFEHISDEELEEIYNNIQVEDLTLLQEEEHKIEKWLKEAGYTKDECIGAGFEQIEGHQGRVMDFEYNGDIEELDVEELAVSIAENVIDDRFYVRVSLYDEEDGEAYRDLFCVEIWLDE